MTRREETTLAVDAFMRVSRAQNGSSDEQFREMHPVDHREDRELDNLVRESLPRWR